MSGNLIVCLANSRKHNGRCVAGKLVEDSFAWIRPVSEPTGGEISQKDTCYEDESEARVLDLINIPFLEAVPDGHQQENCLFDLGVWWSYEGRFPKSKLGLLVDDEPLWLDGYSTSDGLNDKVPCQEMSQLEDSLRFIQVESLTLRADWFGLKWKRRRLQGKFEYDCQEYWLWVTDPIYEKRLSRKKVGEYELGECFLTISLGAPFQNACHKLIAAIIEV